MARHDHIRYTQTTKGKRRGIMRKLVAGLLVAAGLTLSTPALASAATTARPGPSAAVWVGRTAHGLVIAIRMTEIGGRTSFYWQVNNRRGEMIALAGTREVEIPAPDVSFALVSVHSSGGRVEIPEFPLLVRVPLAVGIHF